MSTSSIRFNNDAERKAYQTGMAEVQRKLAGHHRPTAEQIHQRSMIQGLTTVATVKKLSALVKAGIPAAPAGPVTSPARPTITAKAPTRPAAPVAPTRTAKEYSTRTMHRYSNKNWLPVLA